MPIIDFRGPKKPPMPHNILKRTVLPLRILAQQSILVRRATHLDFKFLDSVTNDSKVPEYAGFNTSLYSVDRYGAVRSFDNNDSNDRSSAYHKEHGTIHDSIHCRSTTIQSGSQRCVGVS